jgi:hypothetical protein
LLLRLPYAGTPINHELPGYYKTEFTIIARAPDYLEAKALIEQAVAALENDGREWQNVIYQYVRPLIKPIPFPLSDGSLIEFSVRMSACYVDLTETD